MKWNRNFSAMRTEELVSLYREVGLAHHAALEVGDTRRFNRRIFPFVSGIEKELKSRDGDQRRALLPLYSDGNIQVRLNAACATWTIAPEMARRELEAIRAMRWNPQSLDAGMFIGLADEGIVVPD